MKIFVSHQMKDVHLIDKINELLPKEIELLVAEHVVDTKNTITQKIETMIKSCDVALVLLTENGFNSDFVKQEIGFITALRKPMIQVVESGKESEIKGFNYGKDYIKYDPKKPEKALSKIQELLIVQWTYLKQKQIQKINAERKKEEDKKALLGIGAVATLLLIAWSSD